MFYFTDHTNYYATEVPMSDQYEPENLADEDTGDLTEAAQEAGEVANGPAPEPQELPADEDSRDDSTPIGEGWEEEDLAGLQPAVAPVEADPAVEAKESTPEPEPAPEPEPQELILVDLAVGHLKRLAHGIGAEIKAVDPITAIRLARGAFKVLYKHADANQPTMRREGLPVLLDGIVVGLASYLDQQPGTVTADIASDVDLSGCEFEFAPDATHIIAKKKE